MSKELNKLKEEMRAELVKLKDEVKLELKAFREAMERDLRNEIRELKTEQKSLTESLEFAHGTIEDIKKQLDDEVSKNVQLSTDNEACVPDAHLSKVNCKMQKAGLLMLNNIQGSVTLKYKE